ncbi:hypothetical protein PZ897_20255 [Hoeflea sp. YIM 152468]|uniref:hypothetical protein n=1 Tax=Hoeflea sp. YIM 152468 TaxID=3031759 RepID=UPI0023DBED33|nr:hypothetical protein [Hoeflea sp. YIM 152468]MDF1610520.1 hypothetical protein [Hoeflea sp. YIM 152468]
MSSKLKVPPLPVESEKEKLSQVDKFKQAARELETDDDEARFDERLNKIVKAPAKKPPKDQASSE